MNILQSVLNFLHALLDWWFIVEPWEQAVRVRFGKHVGLFGPGTHIKIPFFDAVYKQNTRRRLISMGSQTLTTSDRKVVTIHSTVGYVIKDVLKLQQTLHDADGTIMQHVTARVANDLATHTLAESSPANVAARVKAQLSLEQYGLTDIEFAITSYVADINTLRLLSDGSAPYFAYAILQTWIPQGAGVPSSGR